jgi:murein DD-endopeptidase MepM/ murein hydrolase activator NlpD
MRRALAAAVLVAALASFAGSASADTFQVVPSTTASVSLPSAELPNGPGSLLLPTNAFAAPFGLPATRSYEELQELWRRAGSAYGIPWQVLAAINKIESNFGRNMGPSSAGAVGWMQFMPDTWLRWGTDGNGDGVSDPWSPEDGVFSAARYLAAAGGRTDISRAIFAYNHAQWYVDDVLELAALFGGGGGDAGVVFTLARIAIALDDAQGQVASLSEALAAATQRELELSARAEELARPADDLRLLLSDRLAAEKDAFMADQERLAATAEVERLRRELEQAEASLEAARSGAHSASFAPAAADLLGMPSRADGYVFPVGGGPGVVSVGHGHHDYPAADIAAPHGSPVVALADAVVLTLTDDGACGIGLTLRSLDGLEWVYCHLSHRDAAVQPGVVLAAGQWIGLVGSTGHSTGPHLHLGLRPARYPQEMPWFEEFAGIAFTWQDAGPADTSMPGPVFAVVPPPAAEADVIEFTVNGS